MCAIIDANAVGEVFTADRRPPAEQFFDWLETPRGRLVVGGKLREELSGNGNFEVWAKEGLLSGRVISFPDGAIQRETATVSASELCKSDDPHIIALARVSRARLLYSHDRSLHADFTNPQLVSKPRGRVYPLRESENATRRRRDLLNRTDLCPNG
ncbi:hypothetical protein [Candidatus Palauibacter sp.]|uniref:hypothetical protein n=1 Tax=Candidatus Palauibacter sp. TaxID=3101350 RepID=UPI003B01DAA4